MRYPNLKQELKYLLGSLFIKLLAERCQVKDCHKRLIFASPEDAQHAIVNLGWSRDEHGWKCPIHSADLTGGRKP